MTLRPRLLGVIDIHVTYTLTPTAAGVQVDRVLTCTLPWPLKPLRSVVLRQFRVENERTMQALKAFIET